MQPKGLRRIALLGLVASTGFLLSGPMALAQGQYKEAPTLGEQASVEKVDQTTVRFTDAAPATLFLVAVAKQDGADRTFAMFIPAHYLKKFQGIYAQGRKQWQSDR